MQAVRCQADDYIPRLNSVATDDPVALRDAYDESCEVIFAVLVKAGHFCRLAADQGTAVVLARLGEPFDDFFGHFRLELARSQIIHKEEGRRSLNGDVVHAVIHQIGAHAVVAIHSTGDLQLGADTVNARYQYRVGPLLFIYGKNAPEGPDVGQHIAIEGLMGEVPDAFFGAIGALDVHPRIGVGYGCSLGVLSHGTQSISVSGESAGRLLTGSAGHCSTTPTSSFERGSKMTQPIETGFAAGHRRRASCRLGTSPL